MLRTFDEIDDQWYVLRTFDEIHSFFTHMTVHDYSSLFQGELILHRFHKCQSDEASDMMMKHQYKHVCNV